jgi:hypothetical protein
MNRVFLSAFAAGLDYGAAPGCSTPKPSGVRSGTTFEPRTHAQSAPSQPPQPWSVPRCSRWPIHPPSYSG